MQKEKRKNGKSTYDHVVKYIGIFGGVQGINMLASIVRNKLAAVLLGPSGLGLISLYNTAIALLNNITNFGLSFSAVRHLSEFSNEGRQEELKCYIKTVRLWSLLTAVLGVSVCCILSPFLSKSYFDNYDSWLIFVCLSPVIGLTAVSGGELAILKGARRLKQVAFQSVLNSFCAILTTIPIYYVWGEKGIVSSLVLVALTTLLTTICFSYRSYPFNLTFSRKSFTEGYKMIKLGVAYIVAGIMASCVDFIIRAYIMQTGSETEVGLYNAGYVLIFTYASVVFLAIETDFFPRLSSVNHDVEKSNEVVNRQVEASLVVISPLLVAFMLFLPIILLLLYSDRFMPVVSMAQYAVFLLYFRAMALPLSYMLLAKSRSGVFLLAELLYNIVAVVLVIIGFSEWGLRGAGIALSLASLFDFLLVSVTCRFSCNYKISRRAVSFLAIQLPFGIFALVVTLVFHGLYYWLLGSICLICSLGISLYVLRRETTLLQRISAFLKHKLRF